VIYGDGLQTRDFTYDVSRARELLGHTPRISLSEGVGTTFDAVATHLALPHNRR
jgi:nucleoside-diphosphate-sugar epimerase